MPAGGLHKKMEGSSKSKHTPSTEDILSEFANMMNSDGIKDRIPYNKIVKTDLPYGFEMTNKGLRVKGFKSVRLGRNYAHLRLVAPNVGVPPYTTTNLHIDEIPRNKKWQVKQNEPAWKALLKMNLPKGSKVSWFSTFDGIRIPQKVLIPIKTVDSYKKTYRKITGRDLITEEE